MKRSDKQLAAARDLLANSETLNLRFAASLRHQPAPAPAGSRKAANAALINLSRGDRRL